MNYTVHYHYMGMKEMTAENLSQYFRCRSCGMKFDSFADMQGHILVKHMHKGDIPSEEDD